MTVGLDHHLAAVSIAGSSCRGAHLIDTTRCRARTTGRGGLYARRCRCDCSPHCRRVRIDGDRAFDSEAREPLVES